MRYAIIGCGAAGIAAAEAIRSLDQHGELLLFSDDPHGYYSRPGLAYYLTGEIPEEMLFPFQQSDFNQLRVRRIKARVVCIEPRSHQIELDGGKWVAYDRLLVATGASAVRPKIPGIELEGVVKLDNLEDARRILSLARKARSAVVIGGGITALELVEGLVARRVRTHYLLRGGRYWSNVLDETESRIVEHRLQEEGVQIHYHTEAAQILAKGSRVSGVQTTDGRRIGCDLVAVAIGIKPRTELAERSGIRVERGVMVDEYMRTDQEHIFAAGDVAQVYDPATGTSVLDSLWGPARAQGRTAGLNMAGMNVPYYKPLAFNVTRLANLTTTIIGSVGKGRDQDLPGIARGDSETWRMLPDAIAAQSDFDVNRLRILVGERTMLGAVVMGNQTLSTALQQLILQGADIERIRQQLLQPEAPLGDILADFWKVWTTHRESIRQS